MSIKPTRLTRGRSHIFFVSLSAMLFVAPLAEAQNNKQEIACQIEILKSDLNVVTRFFLSEKSKALLAACAKNKNRASELGRTDKNYIDHNVQDIKYREEIENIEESTRAKKQLAHQPLGYGQMNVSITYQTAKSSDGEQEPQEQQTKKGFTILHGK